MVLKRRTGDRAAMEFLALRMFTDRKDRQLDWAASQGR